MSDPQNTPEISPVPAPVAPPAPAPSPAPAPEQGEPTWLKARLEQAERAGEKKLLDRVGVSDVDALSKAVADSKGAADLQQQLTATKSEAERLAVTTKDQSDRMMAVLSPEQQAAVKAVAGEDHAKRLQTIGALAPTWANQEPPKPVNTAPVGGPPSDPTSPPDHRASYEAMKSSNPFKAAAYGLEHASEVYKPRS